GWRPSPPRNSQPPRPPGQCRPPSARPPARPPYECPSAPPSTVLVFSACMALLTTVNGDIPLVHRGSMYCARLLRVVDSHDPCGATRPGTDRPHHIVPHLRMSNAPQMMQPAPPRPTAACTPMAAESAPMARLPSG